MKKTEWAKVKKIVKAMLPVLQILAPGNKKPSNKV